MSADEAQVKGKMKQVLDESEAGEENLNDQSLLPEEGGGAAIEKQVSQKTGKPESDQKNSKKNEVGMMTRKRKLDELRESEVNLPKVDEPKENSPQDSDDSVAPDSSVKKWIRLIFNDDTIQLTELQCKIYWPLDDKWYPGTFSGYDADTGYHHIIYDDGDEEDIKLSREKIQIFISGDELHKLSSISTDISSDIDENDLNVMIDTTDARFDNLHELGPGDIIWAKLPRYAAWPAIVLEESLVAGCKGLTRKKTGQETFPVQFFGSHDFARVNMKQITSFLKGLLSSFAQKCKRADFTRGLEEARTYIKEDKLSKVMLKMQKNIKTNGCEGNVSEDEDDESE